MISKKKGVTLVILFLFLLVLSLSVTSLDINEEKYVSLTMVTNDDGKCVEDKVNIDYKDTDFNINHRECNFYNGDFSEKYILGESALSLLGLGIQDPYASWGNMLSDAMSIVHIQFAPWILLPGLFIFITVVCFNVVGDNLRDCLDPLLKMEGKV